MSWGREDEQDVAVDRLLDAAGHAFADLGVAKATMADVCRYAGCARSTLYRYFENRHALHVAFVNRAALRIATEMTGPSPEADPHVALTRRILLSLDLVRSDPLLAVWFEPENMAVPIALSRDSEVLSALAATFTDGLPLPAWDDAETRRRGDWLLRSIVSLLAMPATTPAEEHAAVADFVVPALLANPIPSDRPTPGDTP